MASFVLFVYFIVKCTEYNCRAKKKSSKLFFTLLIPCSINLLQRLRFLYLSRETMLAKCKFSTKLFSCLELLDGEYVY